MSLTLWHNPRCSKSRGALALLTERGVQVVERRYLDDPPSEAELRDVLSKLGVGAAALVRRGEALFRELGLAGADDDALIAAMATNPRLVERPVAIVGDRAVIGRPPERVLTLVGEV